MKINSKFLIGIFGITLLLVVAACEREVLDMRKYSNKVDYRPVVSAPLLNGEFDINDLYNPNKDTLITMSGDSVMLAYTLEDMFFFDIADFTDFGDPDTSAFAIIAPATVPNIALPDTQKYGSSEAYQLSFGGISIDSMYMSTCAFVIRAYSTFKHESNLNISSPDIIFKNGSTLDHDFLVSDGTGTYLDSTRINMTDVTIRTVDGKIRLNLTGEIIKSDTNDITVGDKIEITFFSLKGFKDFKAVFGYFGQDTIAISDTAVDSPLQSMAKLYGKANPKNARMRFIYENTFGLPLGLDLAGRAIFEDSSSVTFDPPEIVTGYSRNWKNPLDTGSTTFDKSDIPNIDSIIAYPVPSQFTFKGGTMCFNPGGKSASPVNFFVKDSKISLGLGLEIPLQIYSDLAYVDTLPLSNIINDSLSDKLDMIDYLDLNYDFINEFPFNISVNIIPVNDSTGVVYDTIYLNKIKGEPILKAAPVNAKGFVTASTHTKGAMRLDRDDIEVITEKANKLIVNATIESTEKAANVTTLNTYKLKYKFSITGKAKLNEEQIDLKFF